MVKWNKVTWYSQITAVLLAVLIFYIGFYIGSTENGHPMPEVPSELARLGNDGTEVKILTNTVLNTRNLVFQEVSNDQIIDVLSVANERLGPPNYRIIKGTNQDWLVITKIEGSGTGYIKYVDEWYSVKGITEKVLSYTSKRTLAPYPFKDTQNNEYLETEVQRVSQEDSIVEIKVSEKLCFQTESGGDSSCSESFRIEEYKWDEVQGIFVFENKNMKI